MKNLEQKTCLVTFTQFKVSFEKKWHHYVPTMNPDHKKLNTNIEVLLEHCYENAEIDIDITVLSDFMLLQ